MRVAKHLHDLNFSKYLLQVLFIQLSLINDLYRNLAEGKQEKLLTQLHDPHSSSLHQG